MLWIILKFTLGLIMVHQLFHIIVRVVKARNHYKVLTRQFSGPPHAHWLYGTYQTLTSENLLQRCREWTRKYRDIYLFCLGGYNAGVRAVHPDTIQAILTRPNRKSKLYQFLEPWLGEGLLLSFGNKWKRNRRLLTPAFHFEILQDYVNVFGQSTHVMMDKWEEMMTKTESVEMFEHVSLMTLDSLLKCIYGHSSNCQIEGKGNSYIKAVYELSALYTRRWLYAPYHLDFIYYFSQDGRKFRKYCNVVHEFSQNVLHKRKKEKISRENKAIPQQKYICFVDILQEARDEDGIGLTDLEIQNEVDTFMFAGHDTTASGISWCLYNLAKYPEHQTKCREEVLRVLGDRDQVTWEDLSKFVYLTRCIKESLRVCTTVPFIAKISEDEIKLPDGRTIPAGTWVAVGIYELHHNEIVWENPYVYDPERFTTENISKRSPYSFVPFSAGPRNCIGKNFAMAELQTCIALVLKRFILELDQTKQAELCPEIVLRARNGLWLNLKAYKNKHAHTKARDAV